MSNLDNDQWLSEMGLGQPRSRVASWDEACAESDKRNFHISVTVENHSVCKADGVGFQMRFIMR